MADEEQKRKQTTEGEQKKNVNNDETNILPVATVETQPTVSPSSLVTAEVIPVETQNELNHTADESIFD